jgi:hypothetical protein
VPSLLEQLAGADGGTTLHGLPRTALPPGARIAGLAGELPAALTADRFVWFWVDVRNDGDARWPGLSVRDEVRVALQLRWRDPRSGALVREGALYPLAVDLAPGETVRAQAGTWVPPAGEYDLEIGVVQAGSGWFSETGGGGMLRRRVRVDAPARSEKVDS